MKVTRTALLAVLVVFVSACSGLTSDNNTPAPGVADPQIPEPTSPPYVPANREALAYGLPVAVSSLDLVKSPRSITLADEQDLADDIVIHRILVEHALGPDILRIEQRGDTYSKFPKVAVSAIQFGGLSAELFDEFVPSVYLLATSVTTDQHNLFGEKPARERAVIEGRSVWSSDWREFELVWYPYGEVLYIVMAENPQLLVAALRQLPKPPTAA
jgi:hypothetical protein